MSVWDRLKYFKPNENWGDPDLMDPDFLEKLDDFRHFLGHRIYVVCGTQGRHVDNSYHYQGLAADIIPVRSPTSTLCDSYLAAERFCFGGVGIYPHWNFDSRQLGGLHLDDRPLKMDADNTINYQQARWIGAGRRPQKYYGLTAMNLKRFMIL